MKASLAVMAVFGAGVLWWIASDDPPTAIRNRLTGMVVLVSARIAGRRHDHLLQAWLADLAGTPEEGRPLSPAQRLRYARSCLWAASRLRAADLLDGLLASNARCAVVIAGPLLAAGLFLMLDGGPMALLTHADELGCLGGGLYSLIKLARKWRGVAPAARRPSRSRQE